MILELVHQLYVRLWLLQLKAHVGMLTGIYHEQGLLHQKVDVIVCSISWLILICLSSLQV